MAARTQRRDPVIQDPTGELYGLPTYHWTRAPDGLATRRQLAARGLRKGGQEPAAVIVRGRRLTAYLYRIDLARPQFTLSPAKMAAVWTAAKARQTCTTCGQKELGYIPQQGAPAFGRCWTCMGYPEPDPDPAPLMCPGCNGAERATCPRCEGAAGQADGCRCCDGAGVVACPLCRGL